MADTDVAAILAALDQQRLSFLKALLVVDGVDPGPLSELIYGTYIGLDDLQSKGRIQCADAYELLKAMVLTSRQNTLD